MFNQHIIPPISSTPKIGRNSNMNQTGPQRRTQSTFGMRTGNLSTASNEFLVISKVKQKAEAKKFLETLKNSKDNNPSIKEVPHDTYLMKIRYDREGKPIQRTIVGTMDQYEKPKKKRQERGFSLNRIRDEFVVKPLIKPQVLNKMKYMNSKVTFDPTFGQKKSQSSLIDERLKTITVPKGGDKFKTVYGRKFTNQDLDNFINDYKNRKPEEEDLSELYSSVFHTSLSSIESLKNAPKEFLHWKDKDSRFLRNYETQRKNWKKKAIFLGKKIKAKSPCESLMRKSDTFVEEQLIKTGGLETEKNYYKSMNNWYASLRKSNKEETRHSNFIQKAKGRDPIYVHETCHFRDLNIIKRPKELDLFEEHESLPRCYKHMNVNNQSIKTLERINSVGKLMVQGFNKFDREMEYVKRIPEEERFIVDNFVHENTAEEQ
ncbi:unnamed protein product [Moneuplotes crassus]|uniref:Uncharacterized protein n=1 Tax=Euplotes crassus TaxID=5936 RepID=A0AAD1UAY0_EUPCR|nr:unnamed protein product [Moneuplotes crassus]